MDIYRIMEPPVQRDWTTLSRVVVAWSVIVASRVTAFEPDSSIEFISLSMVNWQQSATKFAIDASILEDRSSEYFDIGTTRVVRRQMIEHYAFDAGKVEYWGVTTSLDGRPVQGDPPRTLLDSTKYIKWWPSIRIALEESVGDDDKSKLTYPRICRCLDAMAFWPDKSVSPTAMSWYLPEAFGEHPYSVKSKSARMDGISCWFLERCDGRDKLWLDPANGFRILARKWFLPASDDKLVWEYEAHCYQYRRSGNRGLQLPALIQTSYYCRKTASEEQSRTTAPILATIMIPVLLPTDVKSDEWRLRRPQYGAGTLVLRRVGSSTTRIRTIPGAATLLSELGNDVSRRFGRHAIRRSDITNSILWESIGAIVGLSAILVIGVQALACTSNHVHAIHPDIRQNRPSDKNV